MAQAAPNLRKQLDPVIAQHVDVLFGEKDFDLATWASMTAEEREWVTAGMRNALVYQVAQNYPGHLISFTQPRIENLPGLKLVDGVLAKAVNVKVHAFVFAPTSAADEQPQEDRASFLSWAWKVLNAFARKDPIDALADAWATGFRPKSTAN